MILSCPRDGSLEGLGTKPEGGKKSNRETAIRGGGRLYMDRSEERKRGSRTARKEMRWCLKKKLSVKGGHEQPGDAGGLNFEGEPRFAASETLVPAKVRFCLGGTREGKEVNPVSPKSKGEMADLDRGKMEETLKSRSEERNTQRAKVFHKVTRGKKNQTARN